MRTVELSRLFADNQERLDLVWLAGRDGGGRTFCHATPRPRLTLAWLAT